MDELYIIAGGGTAALAAARAVRARDRKTGLRMLCGEGVLPYSRPFLTDTVKTGEKAALLVGPEWYEKNNIETVFEKAAAIDPDRKTVFLGNGESVRYSKLLVATGANPFNPVKIVEGGIPVFTLRTEKDAEAIIEKCGRSKKAVVAGGGILGVEAAIALAARGLEVTICELADRLMKLTADEALSSEMTDYLKKLRIDSVTGTSIAENTAAGAALTNGGFIEADFILVSAGIRSETAVAKAAGLAVNRGIVVDNHMAASVPDIYAAGDCAEYNGRVAGLATAAAEQGSVAGAAMAGDISAVYAEKPTATYFNIKDFNFVSVGRVGLAYGQPVAPSKGARLYIENGEVIGAVLTGDAAKARIVSAVQKKLPLDQIVSLITPA